MNDDQQSLETDQQEIEDDRRCADCGSTEAGSCFYCKMD